jgi:HD-GYP domain-containing protein (c-di-GMP phosphodiesterase class II)
MEKKIKELESIVEDLSTSLAESFYQTIQILSAVAESFEHYYEGSHSRWVSAKSAEVSRKLHMSESEAFEIEIAGLLHDIGKCGFKDSLLSKFPNEMKGNEFMQYAQHPQIAKQILTKHSGFSSICDIIMQHHEKLDGSGFPYHLMGKEINPGSAIIAVVDSYHNAFFRRVRDRAVATTTSLQVANTAAYMESTQSRFATSMNYLHQKKGNLFDTKVVDVFTEIIESERKILGNKTTMRLPIGKLENGMIFAEDYFTSYGMLIAARGEIITEDIKRALLRFAESGEVPVKILVLK